MFQRSPLPIKRGELPVTSDNSLTKTYQNLETQSFNQPNYNPELYQPNYQEPRFIPSQSIQPSQPYQPNQAKPNAIYKKDNTFLFITLIVTILLLLFTGFAGYLAINRTREEDNSFIKWYLCGVGIILFIVIMVILYLIVMNY